MSDTITAFHIDRLPLGTVTKTDEGFLMVNAPIAKVGVMSYLLKDGSVRRELVDQETLTNVDSIKSLKLKPVTNTHPQERIVTTRTAKFRNVGAVGDAEFKSDALFAEFSITHQDAIKDVEKGRKQLSPGYRVDLKMESGIFEGERYDATAFEFLARMNQEVDLGSPNSDHVERILFGTRGHPGVGRKVVGVVDAGIAPAGFALRRNGTFRF